MCAVARQLTNCHRQLPAIRFIPERPRSVYVVRRGMINQRRVASRRVGFARWPSIASTIGELGRNMAVRRRVSRSVSWTLVLFLPSFSLPRSQVVYRAGINVHFLRARAWKISYAARRIRRGIFNDQLSSVSRALIRSMGTDGKRKCRELYSAADRYRRGLWRVAYTRRR